MATRSQPPPPAAVNFVTELFLEGAFAAAASIRAGQRASKAEQLVPGKDAQEQRPRFVPDKERPWRLAA
jgi:hypothetical protein